MTAGPQGGSAGGDPGPSTGRPSSRLPLRPPMAPKSEPAVSARDDRRSAEILTGMPRDFGPADYRFFPSLLPCACSQVQAYSACSQVGHWLRFRLNLAFTALALASVLMVTTVG